jgi:putative ABC transport system permease protein
MREHNPGFDREQIMVVRGYGFQPYTVHKDFKNRLMTNPAIASVAMSSAAPGDEVIELSLRPKVWIGNSSEKSELKYHIIDDEFFPALGISFVAGRNFDKGAESNKTSIIVNERATRALGFKNPADALSIPLNGLSEKPMTIIGVVRDYHQRSFRADHEPIIFAPAWSSDFGWNSRYHFIKLSPSEDVTADWFAEQTSFIKNKWNESSPGQPFNYFFLDTYFDSQYQSEIYFSALFTFFSAFTVLITFLGLFGVVANMTLYRAREVAIRKVLGANASNILVLMSGGFLRTLTIASVISTPIAILIAGNWLKAFAFRISLAPWMFFLPVITTGLIVILIVVLRSIRMVSAQPAESLRYE